MDNYAHYVETRITIYERQSAYTVLRTGGSELCPIMHNVDKDQKGSQKRCKQLLCTGLGRITGNWNTFLESHRHVFTTCFHSKNIILKHRCGWGSSGDSLHLHSGPHTFWHCWILEIQALPCLPCSLALPALPHPHPQGELHRSLLLELLL